MEKKTQNILIGVGLVVLLTIGWYISVKNSFITMDEAISASWAQVENQMQRRYDLIPNLVNTVTEFEEFGRCIYRIIFGEVNEER